MSTQTFSEGTLSIAQTLTEDAVTLVWSGKSNDREPGRFLMPLLDAALNLAQAASRPVVLDFSGLDYMNSSTFSPLVKALDQASRGGLSVRIEFAQARKWQQLSFTALKAFATPDGRISFRAK